MKKRIVAAIAMVLVATSVYAQEPKDYSGSYMCRPIGTSGFGYDKAKKRWETTTFDTATWEHFVKVTAMNDQTAGKANNPQFRAYSVLVNRADKSGGEPSKCWGKSPLDVPFEAVPIFSDTMFCETIDMHLSINFDKMRFEALSSGSYTSGKEAVFDKFALPAYVQIGTCVRLD